LLLLNIKLTILNYWLLLKMLSPVIDWRIKSILKKHFSHSYSFTVKQFNLTRLKKQCCYNILILLKYELHMLFKYLFIFYLLNLT